MSRLRRRIDRNTFRNGIYMKKLEENPEDQNAIDMLEYYASWDEQKLLQEDSLEWQRDNLEYDLRTSDWLAEKCENDDYAQQLYAALCNNDFIKNDVWPLLKDQRWGCSWRYAGGIIADIRERGDYMDWYCSGGEGTVSDEVKEDLFKLGWLVAEDSYEE